MEVWFWTPYGGSFLPLGRICPYALSNKVCVDTWVVRQSSPVHPCIKDFPLQVRGELSWWSNPWEERWEVAEFWLNFHTNKAAAQEAIRDRSRQRCWLPNPPQESDMVEFLKLSLHLLACSVRSPLRSCGQLRCTDNIWTFKPQAFSNVILF